MSTIKITGHETITGHDGDTFILEGRGASLTIGSNINSTFIMNGPNQSLIFDQNHGPTKNEHVTIRGSNDHIHDPPKGGRIAPGPPEH